MTQTPLFGIHDKNRLRKFIRIYIRHGDSGNVIEMVGGGRLRPSKSLKDCIVSLVNGNRELIMKTDRKWPTR